VAPRDLTRFGWLSIAAALATLGMKLVAWLLTGSVGLLSDALESTVNLAAASLMVVALRVAVMPPDESHHYGHDKAELFSAAAEGILIVTAAALILWTAGARLLHPQPVDHVGIGLAVSTLASLVNLGVAIVLLRAGRAHSSHALIADARHLLSDVFTSAGVVVGVLLVGFTGWQRLDPIVALLVGVNIVVIGSRLVWRAVAALMDPPLQATEQAAISAVLARYESDGIAFHAVRTRMAGHRRFVSLHVLVPGAWTVKAGHELVERMESDLRSAVPHLVVLSHLEPIDEASSYLDQHLDRASEAEAADARAADVV
jgi:cation diffusion facilitator family transporter